MPVLLQPRGLDRPGLPTLEANQAATLVHVLEPLSAPFDLTNAGWVIYNLHLGLGNFGKKAGARGNHRLNAIASAVAQAAEWLPRPARRPDVVVTDQATLWTCLLAIDPVTADPKLLETTGALYFLVKSGSPAPSDPILRALFESCLSTRASSEEVRAAQTSVALIACSSLLVKASAQLQSKATSRGSAASDMLEARVERQMSGAYRFDLRSRIENATVSRGLTPNDVIDTAKQVKQGAEAGSGRLVIVAMAHWLGVMPADMAPMRILSVSAGLIRMDASSSYATINLAGVLTELARTQLHGVLISGDLVIVPLPAWLTQLLRPLRQASPEAESLLELPGMRFSSMEMRRLLCELNLPSRITAGKFVSDRALPLIEVVHDPIRLALATLDFSRIHKVAPAYEHLTQAEQLESLAMRSQLNGWGALSVAPVASHGYLSKVTPPTSSVTAIGEALRRKVEALSPGPNAGIPRLMSHHEAFIRYNAFISACAWLLRGQETSLVPAAVLCWISSLPFNDKALPGTKTMTPEIVIGPVLKQQLRLLKAHYLALAFRLEQRASQGPTWIPQVVQKLRRIAEGAPDLPLLVIVRDASLQAYTHLDLVRDLGDDWVGKADAIRHAGSDVLRGAGFGYASREAARRHVGGARPIVTATSAWSRNDWAAECGRMQDAVFAAFGLAPLGGLIKSLPRDA